MYLPSIVQVTANLRHETVFLSLDELKWSGLVFVSLVVFFPAFDLVCAQQAAVDDIRARLYVAAVLLNHNADPIFYGFDLIKVIKCV